MQSGRRRLAILVVVAACGNNGNAPDLVDAPHAVDTTVPAGLAIAPASADLGTVGVGAQSATMAFALSNPGALATAPLTIALTDPFAVATTTCAGPLAAGASCSVDVIVSPVNVGTTTGTLTVSAAGVAAAVAQLTAVAVTTEGYDVSPTGNGFGTLGVGMTSAPVTFTVTNLSGLAFMPPTVTTGGSDPSQFAISNDTCTGLSLPAEGTCHIDAAFAPTSVGSKTAAVSVTSLGGGIVSFTLTGVGTTDPGGFLVPNPSSNDYGTLAVGQSAGFAFTVTNNGAQTTSPLALAISGANPADFAIGTDTCTGAMLAAGQSCTMQVLFSPTSTGAKHATVTATATQGGTAGVAVTGTGT